MQHNSQSSPLSPTHMHTNTEEARGKIFIKRKLICNYGRNTSRCGLHLLSKKSFPRCMFSCIPNAGGLPHEPATYQTACIPLLPPPPPPAPLRRESHPPKWTDGSLHRIKTIFLLDWQINFCWLVPARQLRQKTKYNGGRRGPFVKIQLVYFPSLMMKETSPLIFHSGPLKNPLNCEKHQSNYCTVVAAELAKDGHRHNMNSC